VIYEVQPDSPAARSGLLPGDNLTAVEGVSVVGLGVGPVVTMLKGEEGTSIAVEIVRGQQKPFSIEITRDIIEINPVITALFGGVGYIKITEFNDNTEKNFLSALETLDKQQITQLVLDLRDNPGGAADQAVAVAKQLIPRGLITRLDFKSEESEDISFYSDLDKKKYNLAVLVNGMSASAAEILAGAVQDARAGTLVGSRTYGKSKVQTVLPLLTPDAYSKYARLGARSVNALKVLELEGAKLTEEDILGWLKLTTGEYFTPAGRRIDQVGLTPDVAVEGYLPLHGIDVHGIDKLPRTTPLAQGSKDIAVINAEKILKLLNYTVNTPDLSLDTITAAALKEYQQKKKIRATGALDILTQAELNKDLDRLILEIDTPLAKAIELLL
ncbi:MAG: S41 family peptidase, partial [Clostridia bacterium]|jgi:carboxyl-terminal processing protease|nr:S41 family peptidase [Clostridia bacterium]